MHIAIITKSASKKSGARVPFELAPCLSKYSKVTIFAQRNKTQKNLKKNLAKNKVSLLFYSNPLDLYKKIKSGNFEVISFHSTLFEMLAARLTGLPIVKTYHGTQFDAYLEKFLPNQKISLIDKLINKSVNLLLYIQQKIELLLSKQVTSISKACQSELKTIYKTDSEIIYNGSTLKPKYPSNTIPWKNQNRPTTLLSVSRITPYKGFHEIIEAVNELRLQGFNIRLTIVGSTFKKNYLVYLKQIKNEKDKIILNIEDNNLSKIYQKTDIYITCDKYLFFGLPVLEAAQFGIPALVLNNNAASELVIHNQSGYLANNKEELRKYLKKLITSTKLRQKFGMNAQKRSFQKFAWQEISKKYYKILSEAINE